MAAEHFFEGQETTQPPPKIVFEFFIVKCMGGACSFEYIRNLPMSDFLKLLKLSIVWESMQKKWEAELATMGMAKKSFM